MNGKEITRVRVMSWRDANEATMWCSFALDIVSFNETQKMSSWTTENAKFKSARSALKVSFWVYLYKEAYT